MIPPQAWDQTGYVLQFTENLYPGRVFVLADLTRIDGQQRRI
jgi:hypothetical protein